MKTSQDIIDIIVDAGAGTAEDILLVLCDGDALAKLGINDEDQEAVEGAFAYVSPPATKTISVPEVKLNDVIQAYGARFVVIERRVHPDCVAAEAKWLSGRIEPFYFGPEKNFVFQGNGLSRISVEH